MSIQNYFYTSFTEENFQNNRKTKFLRTAFLKFLVHVKPWSSKQEYTGAFRWFKCQIVLFMLESVYNLCEVHDLSFLFNLCFKLVYSTFH